MQYRKLLPLKGKYLLKFSEMLEIWSKRTRKKKPIVVVNISADDNVMGRSLHNPPTIRLRLGTDEKYATYIFLHELAHIWRGPSVYGESHDEVYRKFLLQSIDLFGFDKEYALKMEDEYKMLRSFSR